MLHDSEPIVVPVSDDQQPPRLSGVEFAVERSIDRTIVIQTAETNPNKSTSSSSTNSTTRSTTRPVPPPVVISTYESAGAHNSYIWRKLDYFFPTRIAYDPSPQAPTVDYNPSTVFKERYSKTILLVLILGTTALCVTNFILLPLQLFAFGLVVFELLRTRGHVTTWHPWLLRVSEYLVGGWMALVAIVLELLGMKVTLAGDVLTDEQIGEGVFILSNHPTTADWVYLWSFLLRCGDLSRLKIVLKASLHKVPIVGPALQCCRYLFLQREWAKDKEHMEILCEHWAGGVHRIEQIKQSGGASSSNQIQLLIFPEGTDIRPMSYDQSCAYAVKGSNRHGARIRQFHHVLHPRTTGFVHMINLLRKTGAVKAVYDLTVATGYLPITVENLARGIIPSHMHFYLKRYDLSELPTTDVELSDWLFERWCEKDDRLEEFYSQQQGNRQFKQEKDEELKQSQFLAAHQRNLLFKKFSILLGWGLVLLTHGWLFFNHPIIILLLHLAGLISWFVIGKRYKGLDTLILKVEKTYEVQQEKLKQQPPAARTSSATSNTGTGTQNKKKQ